MVTSRYTVFDTVVRAGSFTKAADLLQYSQSAISQSVRALETELGSTLLDRTRGGLALTADGRQYLPYIQSIAAGEKALMEKKREMTGLVNTKIRIGTFTSVSRNLLPPLIREFRNAYPGVSFELRQGEYTSIAADIRAGRLDFGFVNPAFVKDVETIPLFEDTMMAVLPPDHPRAGQDSVSLGELAPEPLIELDEGESSAAVEAFRAHHLTPDIVYKVTDDYSILAMIRQSLGYSFLYQLMLTGFSDGVCVLPVREHFGRTIALAWRDYDTMPVAARRFTDYIRKRTPTLLVELHAGSAEELRGAGHR